jgi:2-succinyl-6-hydroxy-2,4-cyclohexadiene-1-carboxylate synthase
MPKPFQILALHGFTGVGEDFSYLAETTAEMIDWHLPNLPGHGPMPTLDCTPKATIDCVEQARLTIDPSSKRVLLGYSMGARAALLHALAYSNAWDALILISVNPGIEGEDARAKRRLSDGLLAQKIESEGIEAFLEYWQAQPTIKSQSTIPESNRLIMQRNRLLQTPNGLADSLRQFGQGSFPDLWPQVSNSGIPTLLVTGEMDRKYSDISCRLHKLLQQSSIGSIPRSGHSPHLEAPELFADLLINWLSSKAPNQQR